MLFCMVIPEYKSDKDFLFCKMTVTPTCLKYGYQQLTEFSETLNNGTLQVHRNNPFKSIVSLTFAQAIGLFITINHFVLHNPKTKKLPY